MSEYANAVYKFFHEFAETYDCADMDQITNLAYNRVIKENQRFGQAVFNAANELYDFDQLQDPLEYDPYEDDTQISDFLNWLHDNYMV